MSMESSQVILAGEGGQGILFIGVLLGEAAIREGKNAVQTASYGIASRGGFSKAEVVVSAKEIWYPGVTEPDLILAISAQALEKYNNPPPGCLLVYDSSICLEELKNSGEANKRAFPLSKAAENLAKARGKEAMLNMVALGAVIGVTGIVNWETIVKIFEEKFSSPDILSMNLQAIRCGFEMC